jgi:hypothetical protein
LLFAFCFFLFSLFLYGQDEGNRSVQRLSWTGDEYTRRYEIVIEKEEEEKGKYREVLREFTSEIFIDVSLSPGKYRCLVITYDFLNQPGGRSQWMHIEVLAHPEADGLLSVFFLSGTETKLPTDESDNTEPVQVEVDFFISAAWMPSFTIYEKGSRFLGRDSSLAGVTGCFGVLWDKPYYFNPGLELAVSYSLFDAHLLTFGLNLLAMKWLPGETMALTFRLGAGYNLLLPDDRAVHANTGISFLIFVMNHLYMETGLGYAYWFSDPPSNIFRPWIGVGFYK